MPTFTQVLNYVISGNFIAILLFLVVFSIKNYKELIQALGLLRSAKITSLERSLKSKHIKGKSRKLLEDQLEQRYFHLSTGLNLEKPIREKIIDIHSHFKGSVRFQHFIRAQTYYKFDNSTLTVRWGTFEKISFWYNTCLVLLTFVLFIASLLLIFYRMYRS